MVVLLPGLTGGSHDTYVKHMVEHARRSGIRAVVFNSRGTSDGPVTSPQFYSASFTGDVRWGLGVSEVIGFSVVGLRGLRVWIRSVVIF